MNIVNEETELHVITPNEPGIFGRVLGTLANAGVNLRAFCVSSEGREGHFLLITADNKKAEKSLKNARAVRLMSSRRSVKLFLVLLVKRVV